ncbi:bifunctional helix-turn-helix transcriptional regulator/GNAT family N-acetyltransferase [Rhizobium sp. SL86]|uniref:bifunctional helix-turn-helix transcriptional regulator/GNAT family N-acetyltransferase n=1 Tax=Rhizobium sp. SL86 TaxID=2995148 RepID=UPI002273486E|nr:helix-turn-helix domain-containing GNAT family N-acetyltransferase [Rhizobium sp. SL86]MCY1669163.1 helix-turn-helix domain-containing GNAT family N-acetyltransferase [Rhizobium sp. SL86]
MSDLLDTIRRFNRFYTDHLGLLSQAYLQSPYSLTEARVIYEIGARPGVTAADLTRDLTLDPAYLSRILRRLRAENLLRSERDANDRRSQNLFLTDAGQSEWQTLGDQSRRQIEQSLAPLDTDAKNTLVDAMKTVRDLLDLAENNNTPAILRQHRPGDMGWVIEAQTRFYTETFGWNDQFEALAAEVAGQYLKSFDPALERGWIAERNGRRVGSVFIANGGEGIAKLRLLYVDGTARGLGLGKLLVAEAIHFARQCGYRQLSLWTNDNLEAARSIYRKAGFRLVSEERHRMFGPELTGQTWVLDLRPA